MSEVMLELGSGLEIWKVHVDELREQNVNARSMSKPMFDRLSQNISESNRLESLPFVALVDGHLEIVSGHHRTRALRSAGMSELYVIVDVTGLSRDSIKAKQLAHNSLQGEDNEQIVQEIYQSIMDADIKLEAFVDKEFDTSIDKVKIHDIAVNFDYKQVLLTFLPTERELLEKVATEIETTHDGLHLADKALFEPFVKIINKVGDEYDIRSVSTALSKMSEITANYLGMETPDEEAVAIRDLFKTAYVPTDTADKLQEAINLMKDNKQIDNKDLWLALDILVDNYLNG